MNKSTNALFDEKIEHRSTTIKPIKAVEDFLREREIYYTREESDGLCVQIEPTFDCVDNDWSLYIVQLWDGKLFVSPWNATYATSEKLLTKLDNLYPCVEDPYAAHFVFEGYDI